GLSGRARNVMQVAGPARIGDVEDRGAVELHLARQRVEPPASMVADVGDPSLSMPLDDGLIRRARLQIVLPPQAHVALLGRLGRRGTRAQEQERDDEPAAHTGMTPCFFQGRSTFLVAAISRARIRTGRVSRGSITSSTSAPPAAM